MRFVLAKIILIGAAAALPTSLSAQEIAGIPETLKAWKNAAYTQRYFIKVDAPGEAGATGLHPEAALASVLLPLKMIGEGAAVKLEHIALFSENGTLQRANYRAMKGGSEIEISFTTFPGQRRFCLYAGATGVAPDQISPVLVRASFGEARRTTESLVKLRGMTAPPTFVYAPDAPLTLKRFEEMEATMASAPLPPARPVTMGETRPDKQPNINDPECPFFGIQYDIFDHITMVVNPLNYCALYEGFLRCPIEGEYKFAVDTPGAAHLVINGVPIISADRPDENRAPFALNKTIKLTEGVHRVVLHYAEAHPEPGKSNADTKRFGVRVHWQPPFSSGLMCIPPLAFVADMPGVIEAFERAPGAAAPFVHVEPLGHVRSAAHAGDNAAREWVLVNARATNTTAAQRVSIKTLGLSDIVGEPGKKICVWVPAGENVEFSISGNEDSKRAWIWPTLKTGLKDIMEREVMDLEAELLVKSAPAFLYPNESGHIHAESVLSPKPVIIHKTRFDTKYVLSPQNQQNIPGWEMLPPLPRPMAEFKLVSQIGAQIPLTFDVTPDASGRKKKLVSFDAAKLENDALQKTVSITLKLVAGGIDVQTQGFRVLHANARKFPGALAVEAGELVFKPEGAAPGTRSERLVMLVPQEDEASFRRLKPLEIFSTSTGTNEVLFIGDPLVEGAGIKADQWVGLSGRLKNALPNSNWRTVNTAGPHRSRPILNMLAVVCGLSAASADGKLPSQVVLSLGSGDVARQTPLHTFERALDTLLNRLHAGGVQRIVVVGVIPEPWREKQAAPYQERVDTAVRHHHASSVDIFSLWTKDDSNWARRFSIDGAGASPISGAAPNAAALEEIVSQIQSRLK